MKPAEPTPRSTQLLESWKEIAAYLNRDVRTVSRWEKQEGLPVHRHRHGSRSSVYAYPNEIDAWRDSREADAGPTSFWRSRRWAIAAVAATVGLTIWFGPFLNPPAPLVEASGAQLRQLWSGPDVDVFGSVSPDGRLLSYIHWETGDLAVRDLDTGESRLLTGKTESWGPDDSFAHLSRFSPDGETLVYIWFVHHGDYELRLIDVNAEDPASTVRTLYAHEELKWPEPRDWTPDGSRVLATIARKDDSLSLGFISVESGEFEPLITDQFPNLGRTLLSPDGRWIAISGSREKNSETDLFLLAADGSKLQRLTDHPGEDAAMSWTPDGTGIVFRSNRRGQEDLWLLPVRDGQASGPPAVLHSGSSVAREIGMTPDGRFYFGKRAGGRNVYVAEVDFESGRALQEPEVAIESHMGHNLRPSWAPDGKALAYLSARSNADTRGQKFPTLVIQPWPEGQPRELDLGFLRLGRPTWSPDSKSMVFGAREADRGGLYRMALDAAEPEFLVRRGADHYARPNFSADGKSIYDAYSSEWDGRAYSMRRISVDDGAEEVLFERPSRPGWVAHRSPNGAYFAIRERNGETGVSRLLVREAESGEEIELLQTESPERIAIPTWTADSSRIVFFRKNEKNQVSELWSVKPDGSSLMHTSLSAQHVDGLNLEELSVHPDGRHIAFSAGKTRFEIWSLENFLPANNATE